MLFGVVLPNIAEDSDWEKLLAIAMEAERLGYDSLWVSDHFVSPSGHPCGLEAWTVLSALSSATKRVRLGTYVLCNQFRNPSLLAKMASTLDRVSNGRLELGLGAGWIEDEHTAFGFGWDAHAVRVERLRESIRILRKLWTDDDVSHEGKYYRVDSATLVPKPVQRPHPPIWIGGNSRAVRRTVAELGDGWIPVLPKPEEVTSGLREIRGLMQTYGRDSRSLQTAFGGSGCTVIAEDEASVARLAGPLLRSMGVSLDETTCLIGTPEQCVAKIQKYEEVGVQRVVAGFYDFPRLDGMRLFAEKVIPAFAPCCHSDPVKHRDFN